MFKPIGQHRSYVLCPHCDLVSNISSLKKREGGLACPRCNTAVFQKKLSLPASLIYSLCALFLFGLSLSSTFIKMNISGIINQITLPEILGMLYEKDHLFLALVFGCFAFIFPLLVIIFQILILLPNSKWLPIRKNLLSIYHYMRQWTMPEIFLAGVLVSFVKLISYGEIEVQNAFWVYCFFIFVYLFSMLSFPKNQIWELTKSNRFVDKPVFPNQTGREQHLQLCDSCHAVFDDHHEYCPRCHKKVVTRSLSTLQFILACLVTAAILYIPANLIGVMQTLFLGDITTSTILDGVLFMWNEGDYPVAIIIFTASVFIPMFKIIGLMRLCSFTHKPIPRGSDDCKKMMKLYNVIEIIGKWSMIDVFVIIVLVALIRNGQLMTIFPDTGIIFFSCVVIVTMIASHKFDPRLIWDRENTTQMDKQNEQ